jgi:hypothetical protein
MTDKSLIRVRQRAEHAVKDMEDGALKIAAFQTILAKLLAEIDSREELPGKHSKEKPSAGSEPDSLPGRVLVLKSDGFFEEQRMLADVREALGTRGWHYPLTTLSGAMQGLVQRRLLRRQRVTSGNKKVWKYSNP